MRYIFIIVLSIIFFSACKKEEFTDAPHITYKSIKPNVAHSNIPFEFQPAPILTIHLTDGNGDVGFKANSDTSFVYIKNLLTNKMDSFLLPDLKATARKNFEADVEISLVDILETSLLPPPKVDTIYFEVYVKDFAKNKSNVIVTNDPVYFITPL